ncbi:MAG: hypothetical protein MUF01_11140 [Bryobacterales bacterium]|jgi:hypothetical protein|nr:hypothetical protein [Bryobacterales bacterium]
MPIIHTANRLNAIVMDGMRTSTVATLSGRTTGLPIYEVSIQTFIASTFSGANFTRLIQSMEKDNLRDLQKRGPGQPYASLTRQPADHADLLGNLPVAPPPLGYREYNIPANGFNMPGYPRLVADISNKRLYITPTHYDQWFDDFTAASTQPIATPGGNRNPFFLFRSVRIYNDLFD